MYLVLDLGNLHHLGRSVSFGEAADHPAAFTKVNVPPQVFLCFIIGQMVPNFKTHNICAFFAFLGNFIIIFSGSEFSQDCSGFDWPLTNQIALFQCSFSLTTWLFGMIIIDIPRVQEVFPVVLEIKKETLLLVIVYSTPGP